jgi:Mrp family chromosome partitioning ATPase
MEQPFQDIPVRLAKDIIIAPDRSNYIDQKMIATPYYNSFNYSKLPKKYKHVNLSIGIISPKEREGKTLVAANLAASFALGYKRKTILVDFNINNPMLHRIFNIDAKPGLIESFNNQQIWVTQTKIEQLYVLPSGDYRNYTLGLKDLVAIRDVIYSLEREFEFIIIDMGSILPIDDFPALFANEVDGLLMVVDTKKTKRTEIDEVFQYIDDKQILGFVLNRMRNPHSKRK